MIITSVKKCTKSFCRNHNHMVELEQKLITNWLKLLLIWTRGVEAKVQAIWKSQHRKAKVTSNQTTSYIRTQWQTKAEKHIKYVSKWSLENNFRNLQRNCQRRLGNQRSKPEAINIKGNARIIIKTKEAQGWSRIQSKLTTKAATSNGKKQGPK